MKYLNQNDGIEITKVAGKTIESVESGFTEGPYDVIDAYGVRRRSDMTHDNWCLCWRCTRVWLVPICASAGIHVTVDDTQQWSKTILTEDERAYGSPTWRIYEDIYTAAVMRDVTRTTSHVNELAALIRIRRAR